MQTSECKQINTAVGEVWLMSNTWFTGEEFCCQNAIFRVLWLQHSKVLLFEGFWTIIRYLQRMWLKITNARNAWQLLTWIKETLSSSNLSKTATNYNPVSNNCSNGSSHHQYIFLKKTNSNLTKAKSAVSKPI